VWSSLDNEMRPSISFIVTLALNPWSEVTGPVVRTLTYRFGQAAALPQERLLESPDPLAVTAFIGGTVRAKSQPQAGIEVAVKGTGLFTQTDVQGRFTLGRLPWGEYTLVVWPAQGKPREKKIIIPAQDGNYDLEIDQGET
jgi:hypothetical protein